MKILFYAPQMAAFGGMERHVCDLAGVLSSRGHSVTLLTTSNSLGPELRSSLAASGVSLRELARRRGAAGKVTKGLWLLRESLRREPQPWDLIYTNGQSALARLPWLAARAHTRIIHHHHTAADVAEQTTWSGGFRRVLRDAPEIVACSRATQQAIAQAIGRNDVGYLPYLTRCPVDAAQVADRAITPDANLNFGFMGRLVAEKGIAHVCELSQRSDLRGITWHIHGAGPHFPPAYFRDFPNIVYHGAYTSGADQAEILQRLDALVLFSTHNEGMPLSLIEAMSAGLPWIATDRGGTREIALAPENCIVVEQPHSPATLASAVARMAARIRRGATSRLAQRAAYDRAFSPSVVTAAWCSYFERRDLALQSA